MAGDKERDAEAVEEKDVRHNAGLGRAYYELPHYSNC